MDDYLKKCIRVSVMKIAMLALVDIIIGYKDYEEIYLRYTADKSQFTSFNAARMQRI